MKKALLVLAAVSLLAGCSTSDSDRSGQGATGDTDTRTNTGSYQSGTPGAKRASPQGTRMPEDPNNP